MDKSCKIELGVDSFDNFKSLARINTIWKPLIVDWFKMNFDSMPKGNPGLTSIGGVIRDYQGNLVDEYVGGIDIHSSMVEKSCTLLKGIEIVVTLGIKNLEIEGDSKNVRLYQFGSYAQLQLKGYSFGY